MYHGYLNTRCTLQYSMMFINPFSFTVWTIHTLYITVPPPLMLFVNGSPVVEGNTVRVNLMATVPGASFMCELLRKDQPPIVEDCEWKQCI